MINVAPVILCGGSGARLWPLSHAGFSQAIFGFVGHAKQHALLRANGFDLRLSLELN